jgi:hypothetical protein
MINLDEGLRDILRDRILLLFSQGLENVWMRASDQDRYNTATLLGFKDAEWDDLMLYSGVRLH